VKQVRERDVALADGRQVQVYDTGAEAALTVFWHHGTPHTGVPLEPLLAAARARDVRLVTYARPGYGTSSPLPGRDAASAAGDVRQIMDALGVDRFAAMGYSGGGPHALACAVFLPDRVSGVVCLAGMAPFTESFDWYEGMAAPEALKAAAVGRDERARFAETAEFNEDSFTPADWLALDGTWASLGADAVRASQAGPDGQIDDDLVYVTPWGFDLGQVEVPVLVAQGGEDRIAPCSHGEYLTRNLPSAEFWLRPRDGHISILNAGPVGMDWLRDQ
jgi:pimeloyl-ACP methyl ester carboxylesterase